jgi:hypothetical protein
VTKFLRPVNVAPAFKQREQEWLRRMGGFEGLVLKASQDEREPLMHFFLSGGARQLSAEDCKRLAWLLDTLPRRPRPAHRPRGSLTPMNAATKYAAYLVTVAARMWCIRHKVKRAAKKSPRENWRKFAIELAEQAFPQMRGKITDDVVKKCKLKRTDRVADFVRREVLRLAEMEMTEHALEYE